MDYAKAEKIASSLRDAGIDVSYEHVSIWDAKLTQHAAQWAERERLVREGKHRVRLSCPSFLYRLYVPEERRDEVMNRVKHREAVCTRPRVSDRRS